MRDGRRALAAAAMAAMVLASGCDKETPNPGAIKPPKGAPPGAIAAGDDEDDTDGTCALVGSGDVATDLGLGVRAGQALPGTVMTPAGVTKAVPAPACDFRLLGDRTSEGVSIRLATERVKDIRKRIEPRTERLTVTVPLDEGDDLGFEAGTGAEVQEPWQAGRSNVYETARDCGVAVEGSCSLRIKRDPSPDTGGFTPDTLPIGNIQGGFVFQCIDLDGLGGRRVGIEARLQPALTAGTAAIFLFHAEERQEGQSAESEPVGGTGEWQRVRAGIDLPEDPEGGLCFGAYTSGEGSVWLDDVLLTTEKDADLPDGVRMFWQEHGTTLWVVKGDEKIVAVQLAVERGLSRPPREIATAIAGRFVDDL